MMKHFALAVVLVTALAFTIEKREAGACSSCCGSGGAQQFCTCGTCISGSSISIDVVYSGVPTCRVNISSSYGGAGCTTPARLLRTGDANTLNVCGSGSQACTGTAWTASNKIVEAFEGCPDAWNLLMVFNDNCSDQGNPQCTDDALVRVMGINCSP